MADKDRQERNAVRAESSERAVRKDRFLARWSRRKASTRVQEETEHVAAKLTDETSDPAPQAMAEKTDADMPPVESLDADSDYTQFLSPKVSERLRRAALRKLFHLPRYNVMDGLDTYIADCRHYTPLGDTITADMRHEMERQAEAARDAAEQKTSTVVTKDLQPPAPGVTAPATGTTPEHRSQPPPADASRQHGIGPDRNDPPSGTEPDNGPRTSS
jgi:hypothetical protein